VPEVNTRRRAIASGLGGAWAQGHVHARLRRVLPGQELERLRTAYDARSRQVAILLSLLADAEDRSRRLTAREADAIGFRLRAERAEREAVAQKARADALEAELARRLERVETLERRFRVLRLVRVAHVLRRMTRFIHRR
jgi:hypothetical protein